MKTITLALLTIILIACNSTSKEAEKIKQQVIDSLKVEHAKEIKEIKSTSFKPLQVSKYNPERLQYQGEIISTKIWQDINGENIVLFTASKEELFVYHYAIKNENIKLIRKVYDFEKNCEFDLSIGFIDKSIEVTDLDQNNYGEITFAYKKSCRSDMSPMILKLLTLENGEKYIIRGTTIIEVDYGSSYGGEKNIDPSFYNAPKLFLTNANRIWGEIVKESF